MEWEGYDSNLLYITARLHTSPSTHIQPQSTTLLLSRSSKHSLQLHNFTLTPQPPTMLQNYAKDLHTERQFLGT